MHYNFGSKEHEWPWSFQRSVAHILINKIAILSQTKGPSHSVSYCCQTNF